MAFQFGDEIRIGRHGYEVMAGGMDGRLPYLGHRIYIDAYRDNNRQTFDRWMAKPEVRVGDTINIDGIGSFVVAARTPMSAFDHTMLLTGKDTDHGNA